MIQTDLLTGINSRRWFFTKSGILLKKYPIANRAILAIDIDHFKLVNDRYGHSWWDKALQIVAKTLERKLEKIVSAINHANSWEGQKVYAEIWRIGGEEFVIQLVGVNSEQALKIGEELRVSIENRLSKFENGDTSMPTSSITISIGISTFQNIELDKMSNNQADIMEQADRALYYAKHTGRNRVISYNDNLLDIAQDSKKEEFLLPVRKNPRMEKSM